MAHVCVTTVSNLTHVCATHAYITSTLRNLLYSAVSRKIKNAETIIVSAFCGVFHDTKVIRVVSDILHSTELICSVLSFVPIFLTTNCTRHDFIGFP